MTILSFRDASTHLTGTLAGQDKLKALESGLLVWGQPLPRHEWKRSFHVVVGADLVYDEECDVHGLLQTAEELLLPQGTLIIGMMSRSHLVERWFEQQMGGLGCDWSRKSFTPENCMQSKIIVYTLTLNATL